MAEGGYFNRAARRGGGDPAFVLAASIAGLSREHANVLSYALELHKSAKENEIPVADVIAKAREIGYIECSDEDAKWLETFLTEP